MHIRQFEAGTDGVRSTRFYIVIDSRPVIGPFRSISEAQGCLRPVHHEQPGSKLYPTTVRKPLGDNKRFV
jgi:hypothetical protein